ncbi:MAG: transcription elongation factor GreA [Phycisphaeraceae bacterium]|nr:transcription elongation factor GreA [Phycisphaeraceae bacterium]MCW5761721.1 transcription elongation factor GreA [Phycisphaeraceae bacterium]
MELLTREEKEKLERRLDELRANRPVISERIAEARALGDLKENAEYHASREQQGLEEAEIRRLEDRLARAQVVDNSAAKSAEVVFIGSVVKLRNVTTGDEDVYRLVGETSGSITLEYIEVTASSPMGEALMKARVGEQVRVKAPRGIKTFEVIELL